MVVMHSPKPIILLAALAMLSGCAAPWSKLLDESEIDLAESQTPRVYTRPAPAARDSEYQPKFAYTPQQQYQPRPQAKPSADEARLARELERLTRLNDELGKTVAAAREEQAQRSSEPERKPTGSGLPAVPSSHIATPIEIALASAETPEERPPPKEQARQEDDSKPAANEKKVEEPKPAYQAGDWLQARDRAIAQLLEEISLARADKSRGEEVAQLETLLRMHYALAGRRDDAARPVKELREQEQEFWRHEALGLIDLLAADRLASESRRYAVALHSLEEAESHLAAAGSLTLRHMALCRKVQDFGVTERFKSNDFARNQEVLLYVELRNFTAKQLDDHTYETELQGSYRILDRGGVARAERTLPLDKQTCANLRRDYYIAYRLYIPSELAPGAYTLELTIEDKKGNKSNNALLDFNVTQ